MRRGSARKLTANQTQSPTTVSASNGTMTDIALAEQLEKLPADQLVERVLAENPGPACITCSFQAEDMIVLDFLRKLRPDIPVLFLDTGYHFAETYAYRDKMQQAWHLNVTNLAAQQTVAD